MSYPLLKDILSKSLYSVLAHVWEICEPGVVAHVPKNGVPLCIITLPQYQSICVYGTSTSRIQIVMYVGQDTASEHDKSSTHHSEYTGNAVYILHCICVVVNCSACISISAPTTALWPALHF